MIKAVIFDYNGVLSKYLFKQRSIYGLARSLEADGLKTAVLSNMVYPLAKLLRLRGDFKPFKNVVISSEVGSMKPHPEIYKIVLDHLKVNAEECLFIDDRPHNLRTAQQMGMTVIHAKNSKQIIKDVLSLVKLQN